MQKGDFRGNDYVYFLDYKVVSKVYTYVKTLQLHTSNMCSFYISFILNEAEKTKEPKTKSRKKNYLLLNFLDYYRS